MQTNTNSLVNWSIGAFGNTKMLKELFSYCGFDLNIKEYNKEELKYYTMIAKEEHLNPFEVKDMGDYIIVYLGDSQQ